LLLAFVIPSYKRISNLFRPAILGTCRYFVNEAQLLREDEFDGRIEADIAVDDLAALVDDEERGNRVDAIELSGLAFSDRARREKAASFHMGQRQLSPLIQSLAPE
jgi:hypothetical protein